MRRSLIAVSFVLLSNASYADPVYCKIDDFTVTDGDNKTVDWTMTVSNKRSGDKPNCAVNWDTNSFMMNIEVTKPSKINITKISSNTTIRYFPKKIGDDSLTIKRTWQGSVGKPYTAIVTYKIKVVDHEL